MLMLNNKEIAANDNKEFGAHSVILWGSDDGHLHALTIGDSSNSMLKRHHVMLEECLSDCDHLDAIYNLRGLLGAVEEEMKRRRLMIMEAIAQ